jgi:hypothetical protein
MARELKDSHRHVLPGNILTGPPVPTEEGHKHKVEGGQGWTSSAAGGPNDGHRHTANGQGTSIPVNAMRDTQLAEGESGEAKKAS